MCIRPFVMEGVEYRHDQPVDTTGVEVRRLRQMYDARMIDPVKHEQVAALLQSKPAPKAQSKPAKPAQAPAPASAPSPVAAAPAVAAPAAPGGLRAEHKGFGRWFVLDAAGAEVAGPMTREAAEAQALATA